MRKLYFIILALAGLVSCASVHKSVGQDKEYSVVMIGDTHYEKLPASTYHEGFAKMNEERRTNVQLYGEMWQDREVRLLKRAAGLVGSDTRFVLQTGDLIMGYTKDAPTHKAFLDDGFTALKRIFGSRVPLITVVGNHDVRGNSGKVAAKAYSDYMPARMGAEIGKDVKSTTFSFNVGPDAYIVIDFNSPDAALIDRLLDETKGCRYTFIVIHAPVFPYDHVSYYDWCLYGRGKSRDDALRQHFLARFAERDAIVLCGHTHKTEFADWYSPEGGRITQLTLNSVWSKDKHGKYKPSITTPDKFGSASLKKIEKQGGTPSDRQLELYAQTISGLKTYIGASSAGSYKMYVSDKGVSVDFYPGDSVSPATTFVLR